MSVRSTLTRLRIISQRLAKACPTRIGVFNTDALSEAESDKKLDKRHAVEEAMTGALLRKCPNCEQPYIKEDG